MRNNLERIVNMAEKEAKDDATRRITKEERTAIKQRIKEAKKAGMAFKAFLANLQSETPDLNESTVYTWWQGEKAVTEGTQQAGVGTASKVGNPSEKLAALLRKEGMLVEKVRKAQAELDSVRKQVQTQWDLRTQSTV